MASRRAAVACLAIVAVAIALALPSSDAYWNATTTWSGAATSTTFPLGPYAVWGAVSSSQSGWGALDQGYPLLAASGTWTSLAATGSRTCGVNSGGALYCWGDALYGTSGANVTNTRLVVPTVIGAATTWTSVTTGTNLTCGLQSTALYCWGDNTYGEMGIGTTTSAVAPLATAVTGTWSAVAAGADFACGVQSGGALYCWGNNASGQLGLGTSTGSQASPVHVGSATWIAVTAGSNFACGLQTGGALYCWGGNASGQLGLGDTAATHTAPTRVGTSTWSSAVAGNTHTCALPGDGTLYCWGNNASGQLGLGDQTTPRTSPQQVGTASTWSTVSPGTDHTCAVSTTKAIWCWGSSASGQLGNGDTVTRTTPRQVISTMTWTAVTSGGAHACAIRNAGTATVWCWGDNDYGQLGVESSPRSTPFSPRVGSAYTMFTVGSSSICGLRADSTLWCWGSNNRGQLGTGDYNGQYAPTQVAGSWAVVSFGWDHICGIKTGGAAYCWGKDDNGRSGTGLSYSPVNYINTPQPVLAGTSNFSGSSWITIAGTAYDTCGIRDDHTLYCWGSDLYGEIGNNQANTTIYAVPTRENFGYTDWQAVTGGERYACGLRTGGALYCWGSNSDGQLGIGAAAGSQVSVPTHVGTDSWLSISGGAFHICAIRSDHTLWCWGDNATGEIGNNSTTDVNTPQQESLHATNWTTVAVGGTISSGDSTCASRSDNTVYCWGLDTSGQLGQGATGSPLKVPTLVPGLSASAVYGGDHAITMISPQ